MFSCSWIGNELLILKCITILIIPIRGEWWYREKNAQGSQAFAIAFAIIHLWIERWFSSDFTMICIVHAILHNPHVHLTLGWTHSTTYWSKQTWFHVFSNQIFYFSWKYTECNMKTISCIWWILIWLWSHEREIISMFNTRNAHCKLWEQESRK